jgi:membrane protease YdiL (CAAX protease family)
MKPQIKPISFFTSLVVFLGGAALFLINERVIIPYLDQLGASKLVQFLTYISPFGLFFFGALCGYRQEGNPWNWKALKTRFRYKPIKGKMWLWTLLFVAIDTASYVLVYKLAFPFIKKIHDAFPTHEVVKAFMNNGETFAGFDVQGNWWLVGLFFLLYFFNVVGEEILWRGYLWPRQELTHGKYTWVVHGLLWTSFHLFAPYNAIMVLPGALFMSYITQRYQNNTIFLISHATLNGIPLIMLMMNIIG